MIISNANTENTTNANGKKSLNVLTVQPTSKKILDSIAVPNNTNPSYYIFNYVGGGYTILSADLHVEPILAYSETGYFPLSGKLNNGLINWLSINHSNMQKVRNDHSLKVLESVKALWNEILPSITPKAKNLSVLRSLKVAPPPPCQSWITKTTVNPLVKTQWGQNYPYNLLCPTAITYVGHQPTGCVATAMAQVMYYWQKPTTYNWSIMPLDNTYTGNNELARLMHDVGLSVNMQYSDNESTAYESSVPSAFTNTFHYTSANTANYDYNTVINNLNAGQPVMLSGYNTSTSGFWPWQGTTYSDGHIWVCDGYILTSYFTCFPPPTNRGVAGSSTLYHMNWGWNDYGFSSNENGRYNETTWAVTIGNNSYNFQYAKGMVYNIHP